MSSDLHNIQIIFSQIPRVQKLAEAQAQMMPNGGQVLNVVKEKEKSNAANRVHDPDQANKTAAEGRDREYIRNQERDKQQKKKKKPVVDKDGHVDFFG